MTTLTTAMNTRMMKTMNKPNNQKPAPYAVFGAGDKANKALIGFKSQFMSGYEVHICECEGNHAIGDDGVVQNDDITGEYFTMYFCKRESLRAMIRVLQTLDDMWVDELLGKVNLENEDPVIQKAVKMLYKNITPEAQKALMDALNEKSEKSNSDSPFKLAPEARTEIDKYLNGGDNK